MLMNNHSDEFAGFAYADVDLTDSGKEVALFLCVDDWNFEVVYWLLNCWSNRQTMNLADVKGEKLPLTDAAMFEEMNKSIGYVARRLGGLAGGALEKAENVKYDGVDSIKHVLSEMLQCVTEEEEIVQLLGQYIREFTYFEAEEYCLPESHVKPEEVAGAFWSFVCDSFVGYVVELYALRSLKDICIMKKKSSSGNDFMLATHTLLVLSDYRSDIIHEPLAHNCKGSCAAKIISYASEKAAADSQIYNEMFKKNGMWRCYDETGKYNVLNKLLTSVAKAKRFNYAYDEREKISGEVIKMLLECGAQPDGRYAIGKYKGRTNLQLVARFRDEDLGKEVAEALLGKCAEQNIRDFVNAADDQERTALHRASEKGNPRICELLLDKGASLTAQDKFEETALHYALRYRQDKVIGVLLQSPLVSQSLALKDERGRTPIDIAVIKRDYVLIAKLLSKTEEPEAYLGKVNKEQLLRQSIVVGSLDIVSKLFEEGVKLPAGECDDDGRTALHLAAMRDDESSAYEIIFSKIPQTGEDVKNNVVTQDRNGRTGLHEAALKGHANLCLRLLRMNSKVLYVKDRNGKNSLYDAVRGQSKKPDVLRLLQSAYLQKDRAEDDLVDRTGKTPLHFAASEGKVLHVKQLLSSDRMRKRCLRRGDRIGQTALHMAAKGGYIDIVEFLLKKGADPLRERDCDGRTALHYAVQAAIPNKTELVETLLKRCTEEEKSLLLWASAAGLGTAHEKLSADDSLHIFLSAKMKKYERNLLRTAASLREIQMTKELLSRGYPIEDIRDEKWMINLSDEKRNNVDIVSRQIEMIKEQGNDKPAIEDSLGRMDYAHGLAALFLNPYIKPPIAVGITGSWGKGKSSLMLQTERTLLTTAAHMALLQSSKLSSSASNLPHIKRCKLSKVGKRKWKHICNNIKSGDNRNRFAILWDNLKRVLNKPSINDIQKELENFLNNDEFKNIEVFKALAAMDSSEMLEANESKQKEDPSGKQNVPAVLTIKYNAWKYKNDTEALAGLAVEITRELEGIMTPAQWLNTCWRYNWANKKYTILFEIFIPCFFAFVLASSIAWIAWVALGSEKLKKWGEAKYAWPPAAAVTILWTLTRKIKGILAPISSQLMQYVSAPDHMAKLGYQERVISDITFLKAKIGEKPRWVFIIIVWVCSIFSVLLRNGSCGKAMEALKISPASGSHLRIIVFVDDLDRCDESVILQVLSAVNLVLAVCEISVVVGMDKRLIEIAILKKHGDQNKWISLIDNQKLAKMYIQKIIQLPLDLPDPSYEETRKFLRAQLGVLQHNEDKESMEGSLQHNEDKESMEDDTISSSDEGEEEAGQENSDVQGDINVQRPSEITERGHGEAGRKINEVQVDIKEKLANKIIKCFSFTNNLSKEGEGDPGQQNNEVQLDVNVEVPLEITERGEGEIGHVDIKEKLANKIIKCFSFCTTALKNILSKEGEGEAEAGQKNNDMQVDEITEIERRGRELRSQTHGDASVQLNSSTLVVRKLSPFIVRREILFVSYSEGEETAFLYFQRLATEGRKLPREWKRLLNYHRLVWYIFSVSAKAKQLNGWQVQLITWVFVCWEWEENMDVIRKRWKEIVSARESKGLSLLMIVEQLMEKHEREMKAKDGYERTQKNKEGERTVVQIHNDERTTGGIEADHEETKTGGIEADEETKSSSGEEEEVNEKKLVKKLNATSMKLDAVVKSLARMEKQINELQKQVSDQIRKDINELHQQVSGEMEKQIKELQRQVSEEMKKDVNELKTQMVRQENGTKEENMEPEKLQLDNLENWKRMKSALEREVAGFYCAGSNLLKSDIQDKTNLVEMLLNGCTEEEKSLLLWAFAAGFGSADEILCSDDFIRKYFSEKKKKYGCNLLRTAASF